MALFGFGKKKQDIIAAAAGLNFEEEPKKEEAASEEVVEETPAGPSILDEVKEEMDAMKPSELKANFGKNADGSLAEEAPQEEVEEPVEEGGFFKKLVAGLSKTRDNFVRNMDYAFGATEINDDFYEELEEILISGDIGVRTTDAILEKLKEEVRARKIVDPTECKQVLVDAIRSQMDLGDAAYEFEKQRSVVFVIGVNGVGKTTTIGKLAAKLKAMDKKVVIAAADTFRAAAGDQLREWANRVGVDMIGGQDGSDPAAVVFDAIASAKAKNADVLLIDTAGRLHNKKNLMDELSKMNRIIEREYPGAYKESLVVLDATTGQNALNQAKEFKEAADLTGVVLTKMDGTAKGGIAVAIQSELGVPVKYIGVGESVDDLEKFDANQFVKALFL
ncbi:MAG: signal recognition particle-docking protein FtsY [Lachnospiraceae bacterium]|nr:signal recognition particle-docking protein FtsY [Lachnospiraceae bacterium]